MVKLILYGYCTGRASSRKIEKAWWRGRTPPNEIAPARPPPARLRRPPTEEVPYRFLAAGQQHGPTPESAPATAEAAASPSDQMRAKLNTAQGRAIYKRRKQTVEPVFGQIKEIRGLRRFSFRGLEKVQAEWRLICLTPNLLKAWRAAVSLQKAFGAMGPRLWLLPAALTA